MVKHCHLLDVDQEKCRALIETKWDEMALVIYPELLRPDVLCVELGLCRARFSLVGKLTCSLCKDTLGGVADYVIKDSTKAHMVEYMKGPVYCNGEPICMANMDTYLSAAFHAMAAKAKKKPFYCCCKVAGACC